ncbi:FABR229Cp [Eremothecium gossypii FDAG1]|nr:FABR229Cp [Eremothecium gossypii FDAG1]
MSSSMQQAVVLREKGAIVYEHRPVPVIEDPHYVKVKIEKTGICGSDVHYYLHGSIGPFVVRSPMVLGHESSGTVVEVGSDVTRVRIGDRVAIEPGVPSRYSEETKSGHYNLCREMRFAATPPYDGTLVKYYISPEDFLVKLPDSVSLEEGALCEPLAVAVHANRLAGTQFPSRVVVFGAGPVGLLTASVAKAFGATTVAIVDISKHKLCVAPALGLTHPVDSSDCSSPEALANKLRAELRSDVDIAFDCSGAEICIAAAVLICRPGGTHVQVGSSRDYVSFPLAEATVKQLRILGSFRYAAGDYATAVELLASKRVDAARLVTHRFPFDRAVEAYKFNATADEHIIKTIIEGP